MTETFPHAGRRLLNQKEVAWKLRMHPDDFSKAKRRLTDELGFPPTVPGLGIRWDPAAIDAWLDAQWPDHLRHRAARVEEITPDRVAALLDARAETLGEAD